MVLNRYMHPRNLYKDNPPDFVKIAEKYPEFQPFVSLMKNGKSYVNFRNPAAVRVLTKCLLHKDFGLVVDPPSDRLTPTIPLRLNYLLWIEDLLNATTHKSETRNIVDIGTGSLCIYPMLGAKTNPNWRFIATEVDETNYKNALLNIASNGLTERVDVIKVDKDDSMLMHLQSKTTLQQCNRFHCCMCNPPFFSDVSELTMKTGPAANSSCSADAVEMVTEGGDMAFAAKMLEESLQLREQILWYTIMLGKKSTFAVMKKRLSARSDLIVNCYEFCQGRTMRWGIAWTFCVREIDGDKLPKSPLQDSAKLVRLKKPIMFAAKNAPSVHAGYKMLADAFKSLGVAVHVLDQDERKFHLRATATHCTWVHMRKRSRKRKWETNIRATEGQLPVAEETDHVFRNVSSSTRNGDSLGTIALECDIVISTSKPCGILFEFKTENAEQKESLNALVVHLKRSVFSL